jgi:MFS family permease
MPKRPALAVVQRTSSNSAGVAEREMTMSDQKWRMMTARLGWLVAATFLVAMVIFALGRQLHITTPLPGDRPPDATFVENLILSFEHQHEHWIEDLASSLLLAVGFIGLALLGATLRRALDRDDARGAVMAVTLLIAGVIGAASQLLYLGATELATNPEYCDCGFLAEEIVSRQMIHDIAMNVVFWMTDASTVLFAVGLLAFAALGLASGWVSGGLTVYARVLALLAFLSVVWGRVVVPLLLGTGTDVDFFHIAGWITVVFAGLLVPLWAAWLARAAGANDQAEPVPPVSLEV